MDREPRPPEPLVGEGRVLWNLVLFGTEAVSFPLKTFRRARGPRSDSPLIRAAALVGFPFLMASLGRTTPGVLYGVWVFHIGMVLVMGLGYRVMNRKRGPIHSRYVGESFPELVGLPATLSKLVLEPALWVMVGIWACELGQDGIGTFYLIGAFCLIPEALLVTQRDHTLATDAVDARIEAEDRAARVRSKLGE